jgi:hypothetical protein
MINCVIKTHNELRIIKINNSITLNFSRLKINIKCDNSILIYKENKCKNK